MGLLDDMQSGALMGSPLFSMGLGLLAAGGPRMDGAGAGQRLMEGIQNGQAMQDAMIKRKMLTLQEQRAQQQFDMQRDAYYNYPSGQSQSASSAAPQLSYWGGPAGGVAQPEFRDPTAPGQPDTPQSPVGTTTQGNGGSTAELDHLLKMSLANLPGAKEALEIYKYKHDPQQLQPGSFYQNRATGEVSYVPDIKTGLGYGPNGIVRLKGSENIAALEGEKADATEGAKAKYDFTPVPLGNGQTKLMTKADAARALSDQAAQQSATAPAPAPSGQAGGITNPGNMRPPGASTGFASFATPQEGLDAVDKNLLAYGAKGVNTISKIIARWAPPSENNTLAYIADVSKRLGVPADQPLDMGSPLVRQALSTAIMLHEHGPAKVFAQQGGGAAPAQGGATGGGAQVGVTQSPADAAADEANKVRLVGQAQADNAFTKGLSENMVKYADGLNERVKQGADLNMRLQESLKALDSFNSGGGKETRAHLAQMAQGFGLPDSIVNSIAGGNLAAMQEYKKLAVQQAMEQLKQAMGGSGRIAQAEFKVFQDNNPNLDTDVNAVRKIYDFSTRVFNRDLDEQKAFQSYIESGRNPASFPMLWASQMAKQGYTNPDLSATSGQQSGKQSPSIPQGAVNLLRLNPKLAGDFDAKYGAGSASKVLGK